MTQTAKQGFIVLQVLAFSNYQPVFSDDKGLMFFESSDAAQKEFDDCIDEVNEAVEAGNMDEPYQKEDYTIAPATMDGEAIYCTMDGIEYVMHRTHDDWQVNSKKFFWKDKSGRGVTNTFTLGEIFALEDEENYNGELLHEWAKDAGEGDEFDCHNQKYTCIEG